MKTPELKPCPFCGKTPGFACLFRRMRFGRKELCIVEISHSCKGFSFFTSSGSHEEAAEDWNRRVTDAQV